jgi:hypothetical protein
MPNVLLQQLGQRYESLAGEYDSIVTTCERERREPSGAEESRLLQLRDQMRPLVDRVEELRDDEDRRHRAMNALTDIPDISGTEPGGRYHAISGWTPSTGQPQGQPGGPVMPVVGGNGNGYGRPQTRAGRLPLLQASDAQLGRFLHAFQTRSAWQEDLESAGEADSAGGLENRALIMTPTGAMVGAWAQPMATYGIEPRIADLLTNVTADFTNTVQFLRVTAPGQAQMVVEGGPKPDAGAVISRASLPVLKIAAHQEVTTEMVNDFSDASVLVNTELLNGLVRRENIEVVGILINGATNPVLTSPSRLASLAELKAALRAGNMHVDADLVLLNPLDVPSVLAELSDSAGTFMAGAGIINIDPAGQIALWGMRLAQSMSVPVGSVTAGRAGDAWFWTREAPNLRVDPYSFGLTNQISAIVEERYACALIRPGAWGSAQLPPVVGGP